MNTSLANIIKSVFFALIFGLSALTDYLFFSDVFSYGSGLFDAGLTAVVSGLVGILLLDGALFAWVYVFLYANENNNDIRAAAIVGVIVSFLGSALASFAYLSLVSSLWTLPAQMATGVTVAMAVVLVVNLALVLFSAVRSNVAKAASKQSDLLAQATDEAWKLAEDRFTAMLPALAATKANELYAALAADFTTHSVSQAARPEPPTRSDTPLEELSINGHVPSPK